MVRDLLLIWKKQTFGRIIRGVGVHLCRIRSLGGGFKGLVTNYREWGAKNGKGGGGMHVKFYPYEKGDRKSFSHAEGGGGGQQVLG